MSLPYRYLAVGRSALYGMLQRLRLQVRSPKGRCNQPYRNLDNSLELYRPENLRTLLLRSSYLVPYSKLPLNSLGPLDTSLGPVSEVLTQHGTHGLEGC